MHLDPLGRDVVVGLLGRRQVGRSGTVAAVHTVQSLPVTTTVDVTVLVLQVNDVGPPAEVGSSDSAAVV